jgi:hypothetical protein
MVQTMKNIVFFFALVQFAACGYGFSEFCEDRGRAECRQIYNGGCFSDADRNELPLANQYFAQGVGDSQDQCQKKMKTACNDRRQEGEAAQFDDDMAHTCVDYINAVACVDYRKNALEEASEFSVCSAVFIGPENVGDIGSLPASETGISGN